MSISASQKAKGLDKVTCYKCGRPHNVQSKDMPDHLAAIAKKAASVRPPSSGRAATKNRDFQARQ